MDKLKWIRGAALVEFALILSFLVLIMFGICEFGWAMYVSNTLNHVAREGARYASVLPGPITDNDPRVTKKVEEDLGKLLPRYDASDFTIGTTHPNATGDPVTVAISLAFRTFTGLFPMLDGTTLHGEAAMRYER